MTYKALTRKRLRHRARVIRKGVDNSGVDWVETSEMEYGWLPCLLLKRSANPGRDNDRQIGSTVYRIIHLDGDLAVNDRVTIYHWTDYHLPIIQDMFAGPTVRGLAYNETELYKVEYGR